MSCYGFAEIYAQLEEGGQSDINICPLLYIYIYIYICVCVCVCVCVSAMACAKFGVAVLKASMLNWGCQSAMGICALC